MNHEERERSISVSNVAPGFRIQIGSKVFFMIFTRHLYMPTGKSFTAIQSNGVLK